MHNKVCSIVNITERARAGGCAGALLAAERRRAAGRVATLRESLAALTDAARRQADALRAAAMALAEVDDTLRAA